MLPGVLLVLVEGAGLPVEGPGEELPVDGAPEVSGIGPTPAEPLLPPPRLSGAEGVLTSTPLLGVPASEWPLLVFPEPIAAGMLPGLDSLRRSQALSPSVSTSSKALVGPAIGQQERSLHGLEA